MQWHTDLISHIRMSINMHQNVISSLEGVQSSPVIVYIQPIHIYIYIYIHIYIYIYI